jgi:hypothetical protein
VAESMREVRDARRRTPSAQTRRCR